MMTDTAERDAGLMAAADAIMDRAWDGKGWLVHPWCIEQRDAIYAALVAGRRRAEADMRERAWQPIEMAPKDKRILVSDGERVDIASWHDDSGEMLIPDYPKPRWEKFDNSYWQTEGDDWIDVKMWQPLPALPLTTETDHG